MDSATKDTIDIMAASTTLMALVAWLPPTASLFTIVWLGIRIYESDTVQKIVHGQKQLDKQD
jgi:hypothetical protein